MNTQSDQDQLQRQKRYWLIFSGIILAILLGSAPFLDHLSREVSRGDWILLLMLIFGVVVSWWYNTLTILRLLLNQHRLGLQDLSKLADEIDQIKQHIKGKQ